MMKLMFFNVNAANMCIENKFVFLMTDINAKTCSNDVFVINATFIIGDHMDGSLNISSKLSKHPVSQDKVIRQYVAGYV